MDLIDVYVGMQKNEISVEEAAKLVGMSTRSMKFRITRWGHRLPLLLTVLDKIRKDEISRQAAAETLQLSEREINQLMLTWKVERPLKKYLVMRAAAGLKWELRKKFAIDYIAGTMELAEAAESAGVTARQMRRWVSEMLAKHFGMVWKDLRLLSDRKRWRLASEAEAAENLEVSKQQVLLNIAAGRQTLADVAADRALSRKKRYRPHVR